MKIEFESIGTVKNNVTDKKDIGWGEDVSRIVINPELKDGLMRLSEFSHIIVVYYLHEAKFDMKKHLIRRPRDCEDMPLSGIFSQRAKDRPNPIGITSVKLVSIDDNIITVKGLDAVDGTPVLDIKPYFPVYDSKSNAEVPEWVDRLMENYF
ncbi:MAG TPA: tRNA (N6-threonylcarbamoyladenosine(37)-N6)-methyltransferase TrmO [Oscillospiraceae bacterium]|nr:tRNA (N6-threonylcarbamoyladenosine(37)-N6)-methyltransferase TrmO [Oscillospiraceae bacterium]